MSEDISNWIISHSGFKFDEKGHWRQLQTIPKVDDEDNKEWVIVSIACVPVDVLLTAWEGLVRELSEKEIELVNLKEAYLIAEAKIVNETDFKSLYGANNQKVRDNHVKNELSDMVAQKQGLQFSIDFIKNYIPLLKEVIRCKKQIRGEIMVVAVKGIYRDENAKDLNSRIEDLLRHLEIESEGLSEYLMDLTLNHDERREKTFGELFENPTDCYEVITINTKQEVLISVISKLNDILYSGYEETPLTEKKQLKDDFRGMSKAEQGLWFGTQVKPLIKDGMTVQQDVANKLGIYPNTLSNRVKIVYGISWKQYVEFIEQGIY